MSISQSKRIERLETFVERLKMGSYLAKSAGDGTAMIGNPELQPDDVRLAQAATGGDVTTRLNKIEAKLKKVENRLEDACDELGEHLVNSEQTNDDRDRSAGIERDALRTLAKAQASRLRLGTPEGLLERAEKVVSDPTTLGAVIGYVNSGQLAKAADLLADAEGRATQNDEDGAREKVESQIREHSVVASVSELGERVVSFERTLNSLLARLNALETRPQAAAPAPAQTVAKGAHFGRRQVQQPDPRETAEGLITRAEGVIDSPARIGHLSSMAQAGQLDELRQIVEQAELAHETALKKQARRTL